MSRRLAVLLALVLGLFVVEPAYASPIDGFTNGLNDFVNPSQTVIDEGYEREFEQSYEPVLYETRDGEVTEYEEGDNIGPISSFINRMNTVPVGAGSYDLLGAARWFLQSSVGLNITVVVGIVFMWWGVRKALRMVMASFRKGRMTT